MAIGNKRYTIGEEIFNSVTHGVGTVLALIGTGILTTIAVYESDWIGIFSAAFFGFGMVLLYCMSTLYHAFPIPRVKSFFRIMDHCSIFVLITSTYAPFTLVLLRGNNMAYIVFWLLCFCTVAGILTNIFALKRFEKLSLVLYIIMGWAAVWMLPDIIDSLNIIGVVLLICGGLSYTGGIIFYAINKKFMHSVWHMFVLAGNILHYLCIAIYIY